MLTLSLMGSATVAIGLLPTYEMVGLWAPALLITLRIIQGMGIGGEWAVRCCWPTNTRRRSGRLFGSIPQAGVTIGMLMATFIVSLMTLFDETQFLAWGWRIPFLLSSVLVFLGLWIRKDIDETPAFKQVKNPARWRRPAARNAQAPLAGSADCRRSESGGDRPILYLLHLCGQLCHHHPELPEVAGAGIRDPGRAGGHRDDPADGAASDKVGRQKMYTLSVVLLGLFIVPWFLLLDTGTNWGIMLATVVAFGIPVGAGNCGCSAPCALRFSAPMCAIPGSPSATNWVPRWPGAPRRLSPPVCWQNMTGTGGRWPFIWA